MEGDDWKYHHLKHLKIRASIVQMLALWQIAQNELNYYIDTNKSLTLNGIFTPNTLMHFF